MRRGTNLFKERDIESRIFIVVKEVRSGETSQSRTNNGDAGLWVGIGRLPLRSLVVHHISSGARFLVKRRHWCPVN